MKTFSIITSTYNSEKTIQKYFDSILRQDFDMSKIEILIIDGGSTDETLNITIKNLGKVDIKIINNTHRLPEYAKTIGVNQASGKYCVFQDSDEVLVNKNSLALRLEVFNSNSKVKTLTLSELNNPKGYSLWGDYYNSIGDPFSGFMFSPSFSYYEKYKNIYNCKEVLGQVGEYLVCNTKGQALPLLDGVQTFDKNFLLEAFNKKILEVEDIVKISEMLISATENFAVLKDNPVDHYSASSFAQIKSKIYFRIINNIFLDKSAGFSNREGSMKWTQKIKKALFLPYAFFIIPALIDGIKWAIFRKNIAYLIHPILSFYTAYSICYNMFLKKMGIKKKMEKYG